MRWYQAALIASSLTVHFRDYYNRLLEGRQREQGIRTKMRVKNRRKDAGDRLDVDETKGVFRPSLYSIMTFGFAPLCFFLWVHYIRWRYKPGSQGAELGGH